MPRPSFGPSDRFAVCSAALIALAFAGCGGSSPATNTAGSGNGQPPTVVQSNALAAANALRAEAQVPAMTIDGRLNTAATRHAGYQAIEGGNLTHVEPNSANALFTAVQFGDRIRAQNGGVDLFGSSSGHVYYECISSVAGAASMRSLWNTVYHRIPIMRHESTLFGFGDLDIARVQYPTAGVPAFTGNGYATSEFAGLGLSSSAVTASRWPAVGETGVETSFSTDSETPDPVGLQMPGGTPNSLQNPQTEPTDVDVVGPPLHVIFPTSQNWTAVSVAMKHGSTSDPVYILLGFVQPAAFPTTIAGASWDQDLNAGEIFILPKVPLLAGTVYDVAVTATTASSSLSIPAGSWTFTTQ